MEKHNHPESQIAHNRVGGHKHDGVDSTKIDFTNYKPSDFGPIFNHLVTSGILTSSGDPSHNLVVGEITVGETVVTNKVEAPTNLILTSGSSFTDYEFVYIDAQWDPPGTRSANDYSDGYFTAYMDDYYQQTGNSKDHFGQVVEYEVTLYQTGSPLSERTIRTKNLFCRFEPVEPNKDYTVEVRAVNTLNIKSLPVSDDITSSVDATVPDQVTGLEATWGFKGILLKWTHVSDTDVINGKGEYIVEIASDVDFLTVVLTATTSANVIAITDQDNTNNLLQADTDYWARVRAKDSSGNLGDWSASVTGQPKLIDGGFDIVANSITAVEIEANTITANELVKTFNLEADGYVGSPNFVDETTGWRINGAGSAQFNDVEIRGDLESTNYVAGTTGWQLNSDGTLDLNNVIVQSYIESDNYSSGSAGWQINGDGSAEFNDVTIRGVFETDVSPAARVTIYDDTAGGRIYFNLAGNETLAPNVYANLTGSPGSGQRYNDIYVTSGHQNNQSEARLVLSSESANGTFADSRLFLDADTFVLRDSSNSYNQFAWIEPWSRDSVTVPVLGSQYYTTNVYNINSSTLHGSILSMLGVVDGLTAAGPDPITTNNGQYFIQGGESTTAISSGVGQVNFNRTWPNGVLAVVAIPSNNQSQYHYAVSNVTTTYFQISVHDIGTGSIAAGTPTCYVSWIAIGW